MKSAYLAVVCFFSSFSFASPVQSSKNSELVEKRQGPGSYYAITGATGGVHPRLEIRELEKTGEMWNLFLLAMTDFQKMDQNVIDSWYQIAGIHGMPWIPWDGVTGKTDEEGNPVPYGYCPHNMIIFATWHRPYLILFEQKLQQIAKDIANKFEPAATRTRYQDVANKIRLPFWDWAKALPSDQPVVPTALSVEKVQVTQPNGSSGQIDNPLFDYNFHPLDNTQINGTGCPPNSGLGGLPRVCNEQQQTIRASESFNDNAELSSRLRGILTSQRSKLMNLLSIYQTFDQFSSNGKCGPAGRAGNLEDIHGLIHTKNFPGHMSPTAVTAFDPMFWLHHANVDRQMALYQAVYPDTYVESCGAATATYTINQGDPLSANSALTPFHKNANGDFWTSADVRNIQDLSYTYPELVNNPSNATLVASIKAQYSGPSDVLVTAAKKTKRQEGASKTAELYLAEVTVPLYGLDNGEGGASPYDVLVFLGEVSSEPKEWMASEEFVGITSALGGVGMKSDQVSIATIDLSDALEKAISSGATTEEKASEYLKENLHYRLQLGDAEIPKNKVSGLKLKLISTEVEIAQSDDVFDRWVGGFKEHGEVDV